jgi:hypothetical protein
VGVVDPPPLSARVGPIARLEKVKTAAITASTPTGTAHESWRRRSRFSNGMTSRKPGAPNSILPLMAASSAAAGERAGVVQHVRRRAQHRGAEGRERRADSVELVARGPGR